MHSVSPHPSSYRDPSGYIFEQGGVLYRQVNLFYQKDFELFTNSGLYHHLVSNQWLVPHRVIPQNLTGTNNWYQTLQPEIVPVISYPYEWCFDMWKEAALTTLHIAREAINFGMLLKDASAYNLQWHRGKMFFIDTLSFEVYDETKPWIAYRQFCEHFFAPLCLMHFLKLPLQSLFLSYPDGIPLPLAAKMLPYKSKWHLHTQLHIHLHASLSQKTKTNDNSRPFSRKKLLNLFRSLEEAIQSFSYGQSSGVWSGYYNEASQRDGYLEEKRETIGQWLQQINFKTVLDAGANEGTFSEMAIAKAERVVSLDADHFSINNLFKKARQNRWLNVYPLLCDLSHPSPAIGVNNKERSSMVERVHSDLVMALALIHHLAIGKNISFEQLATLFRSFGKLLIIEFVPREDPKVKLMLDQKKDVYFWYTKENFLLAFSKIFKLKEIQEMHSSGRTLYLMEAHEN